MKNLIIVGSLLVGVVPTIIIADDLPDFIDKCTWMTVDVCHVESESAANLTGLTGHTLTGRTTVRKDLIAEIMTLSGTDKCVLLATPNGQTAAVVGTYAEVMQELSRLECKQ